jgi:hypothetical protein
MPQKIPEEERETEDQMARRELGPRGEAGAPGQDDSAAREKAAEVRRV